jgi:hypothetical protein
MTRHLLGFICVLALGVMPMVGCAKPPPGIVLPNDDLLARLTLCEGELKCPPASAAGFSLNFSEKDCLNAARTIEYYFPSADCECAYVPPITVAPQPQNCVVLYDPDMYDCWQPHCPSLNIP